MLLTVAALANRRRKSAARGVTEARQVPSNMERHVSPEKDNPTIMKERRERGEDYPPPRPR